MWPSLLAEEHKYRPHWKRYLQCMQWDPKNRLLNRFKKVVIERRLFVEKGALYYRNKYKKKKYLISLSKESVKTALK